MAQRLIQKLPGDADKRQALTVFVFAGGFAHEHDAGGGIAVGEHQILAVRFKGQPSIARDSSLSASKFAAATEEGTERISPARGAGGAGAAKGPRSGAEFCRSGAAFCAAAGGSAARRSWRPSCGAGSSASSAPMASCQASASKRFARLHRG